MDFFLTLNNIGYEFEMLLSLNKNQVTLKLAFQNDDQSGKYKSK